MVIPLVVVHIREILGWRKIIHGQLKSLGHKQTTMPSQRSQAVELIEKRCSSILKGRLPARDLLTGIPGDIQAIAARFHPGAQKPELRVTPAHMLLCLDHSLGRLIQIQSRPGFSRLAPVSLNELDQLYSCYRDLVSPGPSGRPSVSSLLNLLKNARLLFFTRYLAVDLYLFMGQLVMAMYGEQSSYLMDEKSMDLEQTLMELSRIKTENNNNGSPAMTAIRNNLVGMPGVLVNDPSFSTWKQAVLQAANLIASGYFPGSKSPLFEARIGPLVSQSHVFLNRLGKGEGYPMAGKIFKIRLETIFQTKSISMTLIPPQVRRIVMSTQKTYGWLKWPLNLYMMASKGIFWKIAVDLGWFAGRKAILVLIFGKSFDKAVHELETLYFLSTGEMPKKNIPMFDPTRPR